MNSKNKYYNCEILAPAGTYETMVAAFNAGADAVYVGGNCFSARAFAANFSDEELLSAINYAHFIGKRLYLTINTLLKDNEIDDKLFSYLKPLYEVGLDAVIVQDLGVMQYITKYFPNLPIHCSTQMTITGANYASIFKDTNVTRIVTPRELSFQEIKHISETTGLEIESFVHGALCYCYSGQCLLSSMIGGRSGNRGRCAQPCRLPYSLQEWDIKDKFLLSPKDLCTLNILPDILDANVYSLKIEGRMKKPEYVASVVSIYRKYVDMLINNGRRDYKVDEADIDLLREIYNRGGFTDGFYNKHNSKSIMSIDRPNHIGVNVGKLLSKSKNSFSFKITKNINKGDILEIEGNEFFAPYDILSGTTFNYKGNFQKIKDNSTLYRTRNNKLVEDIVKRYIYNEKGDMLYITKTININVTAYEGEKLKITVLDDKNSIEYYGNEISTAVNKPLLPNDIEKQMRKTGGSEFVVNEVTVDIKGNIFIPIGSMNEARREALRSFKDNILQEFYRNEMLIFPKTETNMVTNTSIETKANTTTSSETESKINVLISTKEQFDVVMVAIKDGLQIETIYLEYVSFSLNSIIQMIQECNVSSIKCIIAMPFIARDNCLSELNENIEVLKNIKADGFLFRNLETYFYFINNEINIKSVIFDSNIYSYNSYDIEYYKSLGADRLTASYELNSKELSRLDVSRLELNIYGYIPVMYSAGCIYKTMDKCRKYSGDNKTCEDLIKLHDSLELIDRKKNRFIVKNVCRYCYNIIYNSVPLSLLNSLDDIYKIPFNSFRVNFTIESSDETKRILDCIKNIDYNYLYNTEYTKGHFKRGVD